MAPIHTQLLRSEVAETVKKCGLHFVDLNLTRHGNRSVIEVFADSDTGVTVEELAKLNRLLQQPVEGHLKDAGPYELVVSSPGSERPLVHPWQFRRHSGRSVSLRLDSPEKDEVVTGLILDSTDDSVTVDLDGTPRRFDLSSISEAKILFTL